MLVFSLVFFLACLLFLYFFLYPFYTVQKWVMAYGSWNYSQAYDTFSSVQDSYLKNIAQYWKWWSLYKNQEYSWALGNFLSTSTWDISFEPLHNLGNTVYMLGSRATNSGEKLQYWNQSLRFYSWALQVNQGSKATQENYDFVKKRINELSQQQKKDGNQDQKSQSWSADNNNSNHNQEQNQDKKKWSQNNKDSTWKSWSGWVSSKTQNSNSWSSQSQSLQQQRDPQYQLKKGSEVGNLSEREKEELKNYQSYLEQLQKQNQQFFNKKPSSDSSSPFGAFVDPFTGKPLFQDNMNQNERDW